MSVRNASATWNGTLNDGSGTMKLGSGLYEGSFSFASRFESGPAPTRKNSSAQPTPAAIRCFSPLC